tara:strand:- start:838 stop:1875 length:1038 start_codon:yes stop_codon:yes gene_type:complete
MKKISKSNPLKIICAIVGLGRSGQDIHIELLKKDKQFKIKGVYDKDKTITNRLSKKLNCKAYANYKEILLDKEIELVIIATNSITHFSLASKALKSYKNIVLEKPITKTLLEAEELKSIANSNNVRIFPFFNFRFIDEFIKIKDLLNKNIIGEIFLIKRNVSYFNRRDDWQSESKFDGGILNAALIHHLDQILQITEGYPLEIFGDLRNIVAKGDADDHCKILLKFKNKILADLEVSWAEKSIENPWTIYGSRGVIRRNSKNLICEYFLEEEVEKIKRNKLSYKSNEKFKWKKLTYQIPNNLKGLSPVFYQKLYTSMKSGKNFEVSVDSVIETMRVLNDIFIKTK